MKHETTLAGFLGAEYGWDDGHASPLHIGERIRTTASRCWITAWNPLGQTVANAGNHAAQTRLLKRLDHAGLKFDAGFARAPISAGKPEWNEPCAVVTGARTEDIDELAIEFRQLAVVVAIPGQAARLRCYRRFWLEAFAESDMDAANVEWVA